MPTMSVLHPTGMKKWFSKTTGKAPSVGDTFEASEKDAAFFRKARWAKDVGASMPVFEQPPEPAPAIQTTRQPYRTRAVIAAKPAESQPAAEETQPTAATDNTYERRDMQATGE